MIHYATCPLRVSLVGGGTDIPEISSALGCGMSVGFSTNLKMNIVGQRYVDGIVLKYSEVEHVYNTASIKHSIFRNVLDRIWPNINSFQFTSMCDVSGGTGLGSSSAFTVALLNIVNSINSLNLSVSELCYLACQAEIEWCGRNIGLQDQFHAGYGGMNKFTFNGMTPPSHQHVLYNHSWCTQDATPFVLVRAGGEVHDSSSQLKAATSYVGVYESLLSLVDPIINAINKEDIPEMAMIVGESWQIKKRTTISAFNNTVDQIIDLAQTVDPKVNGKLLGSGGGGFVLLISNYPDRLLQLFGDKAFRVCVDANGTRSGVIV